MRDKVELDAIAWRWATDTLESWQNEYGSWDGLAEYEELDEEELEYLMNEVQFKIKVK